MRSPATDGNGVAERLPLALMVNTDASTACWPIRHCSPGSQIGLPGEQTWSALGYVGGWAPAGRSGALPPPCGPGRVCWGSGSRGKFWRRAEVGQAAGDLGVLIDVVAGADAVVAVGHRERDATVTRPAHQ